MRLRQPDHIDNDGFAPVNQYEMRRKSGGMGPLAPYKTISTHP